MNNFNFTMLEGNLVNDPVLQKYANGSYQCAFNIGTNRQYTSTDGTKHDETSFFEVTCYDKLAETCAKYLKKGKRVLVSGMLRKLEYRTESGGKRSRVYLEGREVNFLSPCSKGTAPAGPALATKED